ncbi:MAG: hypothetical protein KW793_00195 [Candidatus Doudnabacteria bacterium]|nr:hypothetical protein [Candidatus Doudnabacteria bacterium]
MKDNQRIESILAELYESDPTLKQHDAVLRTMVIELMEIKPDTQFNEQFKQDLKRKLLSLSEIQEEEINKPSLTNNFMKRFQLAGVGIAVVALLAVSAWYLSGVNRNSISNFSAMVSQPNIIKTGSNAFGSLAMLQSSGRGMGGGGGGNNSSSESSTLAPNVSTSTDQKLIAQENPINFKYVYTGDELTLVQENVDVLKRIKNEPNNNLSDIISRMSLGLINLNSFGNTQLQNFSFAEDKDLGYMVNVSLSEGSININENWPKWELFSSSCPMPVDTRMACEPRKIDISKIPADQVLIDAANSFLDQHDITRQAYGEPMVNNDWRVQYEKLSPTERANYWIPEVMNVVYPLNLEGQPVFDESGNPNGMNVSVRVAPEVKVSSIWELTTQNYQSSSYTAENDVQRIMKIVSAGGFRNYMYSDPKGTEVTIELGTPTVSMVKLWNYKDNTNEELLVPALIFPVTKEPTGVGPYYWYRKNVVVPLVKEILDNENSDGPIRIMPAGGGATEPAVVDPVPMKMP